LVPEQSIDLGIENQGSIRSMTSAEDRC
jgi:hypothetical protein